MVADVGIPQQQREKLIEEARARLEWADATGEISAGEAVRSFAETVLTVLGADVDDER
jgi:hypothetical protein